MLRSMESGWETFTLSHVAYVTVDYKVVVSNLFHTGSSFVEKECFKRKTRLSE